MRELLVRGKNTIDPEVTDPGGRSVADSPVKSDFTFTLVQQTQCNSYPKIYKEGKKMHYLNTVTLDS
jgi:hypothetical protein